MGSALGLKAGPTQARAMAPSTIHWVACRSRSGDREAVGGLELGGKSGCIASFEIVFESVLGIAFGLVFGMMLRFNQPNVEPKLV